MVKTRRTVSPAERWRTSVDQLTLPDLARIFEFHNRTEGKSPKTIRWYNEVLGRLGRFLQGEGHSLRIADIGEPEVRAFIDYLQHKTKWSGTAYARPDHLSGEGIQNRVRALKAFFGWLHREGYTDTDRLAGLRNFKVEQKLKDILTAEEIAAILVCFDVRTAAGARDAAILTLMLDGGLRLSEVVGLRLAGVDIDAGYLKVMGKGGKERIIPLTRLMPTARGTVDVTSSGRSTVSPVHPLRRHPADRLGWVPPAASRGAHFLSRPSGASQGAFRTAAYPARRCERIHDPTRTRRTMDIKHLIGGAMARRPWSTALLGLAALLGLVLSACAGSGSGQADGGATSAGQAGAATQTSEGGQVTVKVTWTGATEAPAFTVAMDTHAVDLDGYDLGQLAVLRTDQGQEVRPAGWAAPKGGHHREGRLTFPATAADGRPLIEPGTRAIELVIRDVAGVPERTFRWTL